MMKILTRLGLFIPILSNVNANAKIDEHGLRSKNIVAEGVLDWPTYANTDSRNAHVTDAGRKLSKVSEKSQTIVGGDEVLTQEYPFFVHGDNAVSPSTMICICSILVLQT
jgi:hypothetical protein